MVWNNHGVRIEDPDQVVLEATPHTRLSYTWHSFTPELAEALDFADDFQRRLTAEPRSRATFEIVDESPMVKLTVIHETADAGGAVLESVSGGWPKVFSALKTLLETGTAPGELAS